MPRDYDLEGACYPNEVNFRSPRTHGQGLVHKQRLQNLSVSPNFPQGGDSLVLDVIPDHSEDVDVVQPFKFPPPPILAQIQKQSTQNHQNDRLQDFVERDITDQSNFFNFFSDLFALFALCILHCLNVLNISFC